VLGDDEVERFVHDGFAVVRRAFDDGVAAACREELWARLPVDRHDPSTWTEPVVRIASAWSAPFVAAARAPRLHEAFDQLVGPGRWRPLSGLGTFPIRFPSEADPGDAGWHCDASIDVDGVPGLDVRSTGRALLLLFLLSDVGPDDAPTRVQVGSHLDVPPVLEPAGRKGMTYLDLAAAVAGDDRPVVDATGRAGDVYLCHPFLVHSATFPHRGTAPRFLAQPPLLPAMPFDVHGSGPCPPAVQAIRSALAAGAAADGRDR
jgi:hypothetical protein